MSAARLSIPTAKLNILSDTERAVVDTMTMRLNPTEAMQYLRDSGFKISERSYYRHKSKIESLKWQRLEHIANLFTYQHLQRIDRLELVEKLMWTEYEKEKSAYRRVGILQAIVGMQPYISGYYDATTYVISKRLRTDVLKPEISYLEQDKFKARLKETREQRLTQDMKLSNEEFDAQEQKEIKHLVSHLD